MAKYKFKLREPKAKKETAIFLVVHWPVKNRLVYPTGESIHPDKWQSDKKKSGYQREIVISKRANKMGVKTEQQPVSELNNLLDYYELTAKNTFISFKNKYKQEPTLKVYRELLNIAFKKKALIKHDLISFAESFATTARARTTNKVSEGTVKAYEQTTLHLKGFKEKKNIRTEFDNIDVDFYNGFIKYLTEVKKFTPNTIGKHIKHLKVFIKAAKETDQDIPDYTTKFTGITEETDSIYLNEAELTELFNLDLSDSFRLERVRDLFLLGAYSGLRFSDFSRLSKENLTDDRITIKTQKTGKTVKIPLHHTAKIILKRYEGLDLPTLSNVKMNEYLKELGKRTELLKEKVEITKTKGSVTTTAKVPKHDLLTTHSARRSFATNAYLSGVPTLTIMAITGHKTEKSFLRYIKVTPDEHAKILDLHWKTNNQLKIVM